MKAGESYGLETKNCVDYPNWLAEEVGPDSLKDKKVCLSSEIEVTIEPVEGAK
jgi:hypothetical protein